MIKLASSPWRINGTEIPLHDLLKVEVEGNRLYLHTNEPFPEGIIPEEFFPLSEVARLKATDKELEITFVDDLQMEAVEGGININGVILPLHEVKFSGKQRKITVPLPPSDLSDLVAHFGQPQLEEEKSFFPLQSECELRVYPSGNVCLNRSSLSIPAWTKLELTERGLRATYEEGIKQYGIQKSFALKINPHGESYFDGTILPERAWKKLEITARGIRITPAKPNLIAPEIPYSQEVHWVNYQGKIVLEAVFPEEVKLNTFAPTLAPEVVLEKPEDPFMAIPAYTALDQQLDQLGVTSERLKEVGTTRETVERIYNTLAEITAPILARVNPWNPDLAYMPILGFEVRPPYRADLEMAATHMAEEMGLSCQRIPYVNCLLLREPSKRLLVLIECKR